MKKIFIIFCAAFAALLMKIPAYAGAVDGSINQQFKTMTSANVLIESGENDKAREILSAGSFDIIELETERLHLIAQTFVNQKRYKDAIVIFRYILDNQPGLSKVRAEMAIVYMQTGDWYRADYHMRLALSDNKIPEAEAAALRQLLYIIRANKNWDVWFNFSAAPDNNPSLVAGGEECLDFMGMRLCRQIPEPEKVFGFHIGFGGNYEYKLSTRWGIKSDLSVFTSTYDISKYNTVNIRAASGPRYIWSDGEVWASAVLSRGYYGNTGYNYSAGSRLDISQDITNKLAASLSLQYMPNWYDDYGDFLNGNTISAAPRLTYIINSSMFLNFGLRAENESTAIKSYSNKKYGLNFGFGAELFSGFRIYAEPSATFVFYKAPRITVQDYKLQEIVEKDLIWGGQVSISNNKIKIWDFTPTLVYKYTSRESNIWQREYSKHSIEMQIQKRF